MRSPSTIRTTESRVHRLPSAAIWGDREIAAALQMAFEIAEPRLEDIDCMIQDGIVILRGRPSADIAARLVVLASDIPGVRHVVDRLQPRETAFRHAA